MGMIVSFLSFMLLFNYLDGQPQFTTCPSDPVCLSQPVTYVCNSGDDSLVWIVLDTNGDRVGAVSYTELGNGVGNTDSIGGQFNTVLTVDGSSLVSNITFTPTLNINNYTVQCGAAGTLVNCSIMITDIPSAPISGSIAFYSDRLTFSWSPSTGPCLSHYNVNVTSIDEYTINTNDASLSLPVPSTNDTEYSISVVAIDTGGRYVDPVDERTFVADVPESVTNLTLNHTGLSIDVSWNEPPLFMFLPALSYIIYHNVTDPNTSIIILAPTTRYNIPNATIGSVYTVGVAGVNILGTGPTASTTIISTSITEVSSTTISFLIISTSSTGIVSTSVPSPTTSTSMSTTISTPSNSNTVPVVTSMSEATSATTTSTISTSTGGLDNTVYIGIGAGAAVIVIVILILIIVGCLIWRKPWKGEKENTTTNTVIYDTPTDTVQVPNVPVSMNTAYGTATANKGVVHTTDNVAYGHVNNTSNTGARSTDTAVYEAVQ